MPDSVGPNNPGPGDTPPRRPPPKIILVPPAEVPPEAFRALHRRALARAALALLPPAIVAGMWIAVLTVTGPPDDGTTIDSFSGVTIILTAPALAPLAIVLANWYGNHCALRRKRALAAAWDYMYPGLRAAWLAEPAAAAASRVWYEYAGRSAAKLHARIAETVERHDGDPTRPTIVCLGPVAVPRVPDVPDAALVVRIGGPPTGARQLVAWLWIAGWLSFLYIFSRRFLPPGQWLCMSWAALNAAPLALVYLRALFTQAYVRVHSGRIEWIRFTTFWRRGRVRNFSLAGPSTIVVRGDARSPRRVALVPVAMSAHVGGDSYLLPPGVLSEHCEEIWRRLLSTYVAPEAPTDRPLDL